MIKNVEEDWGFTRNIKSSPKNVISKRKGKRKNIIKQPCIWR